MNDSNKSELLSAYLDREASVAEQAEIEQALESDSQNRQLLEQYAQLGDLIRELPQGNVRSSFTGSVMDKVREQAQATDSEATSSDPAGQQRQEQAVDAKVTPNDALATAKRSQQWLMWGIVAAAAAALLLAAYPAGLYDFLSPETGNQEIVEQGQPGTPSELVTDPSPRTPNIDVGPGTNQVIPSPNQDPNTPAVNPNALVSDPPNVPGTIDPVVPGPNSLDNPGGANSPFVSPEDEKILRLLESLVLVKIQCTPPTAETREFEKILKKYKIKVAEKATPERPDNAPLPTTVVYYIESSVAQAEAVLSEVSARSNEFTAMNMVTETHTTRNTLNVAPNETPDIPDALPNNGSFAEKMHLQTEAELKAMKGQPGQPSSSMQVLPFLRGQSDLDDILGRSQVNAEHLVRMLVVLETVEPKNEE